MCTLFLYQFDWLIDVFAIVIDFTRVLHTVGNMATELSTDLLAELAELLFKQLS
jgi:hypothetical protein